MGEKGVPPILEDVYDTATGLMDLGALPEVERDPNPDNKKSLAVHRRRKTWDRLDKTSNAVREQLPTQTSNGLVTTLP